MAVPARNIRRVKAVQRFCLDDEVFQRLVDRMTKVQLPIRVRRTIMQDEFRLTTILFGYALVEIQLLPLLQNTGFPLRQIGLHRKLGMR